MKKIIISFIILVAMLFIIKPLFLIQNKEVNAKVGVFYYPWYSGEEQGGHINWYKSVMRTKLDPMQEPSLGQYHSQDPEVIKQHIAWSKQGNIDVWVTSWWGPNDFTDITIKDYIMTNPYANELEFALLYEAQGRLGDFNDPDFTNLYTDIEYMKEHYFNKPNYLKIDNKPVIYFYLSREYFKGDNIEELKKLKEMYPDIYIIGDDLFMFVNLPARSGLLDAVNNYDVYGQSYGMYDNGSTRLELWFLSQFYRMASIGGKIFGYDFIPSVAPGYNDTAVREGHYPATRYFNNGQNVFEQTILKAAFPYLDKDTENLMLVTSFNEWYEDTQIEPTKGTQNPTTNDSYDNIYSEGFSWEDYGTNYLEIIDRLTR